MTKSTAIRKVLDAQLLIASYAGTAPAEAASAIEREARAQRAALRLAPCGVDLSEWFKSVEILERTVSRLRNAAEREARLSSELDAMPPRGTC